MYRGFFDSERNRDTLSDFFDKTFYHRTTVVRGCSLSLKSYANTSLFKTITGIGRPVALLQQHLVHGHVYILYIIMSYLIDIILLIILIDIIL